MGSAAICGRAGADTAVLRLAPSRSRKPVVVDVANLNEGQVSGKRLPGGVVQMRREARSFIQEHPDNAETRSSGPEIASFL